METGAVSMLVAVPARKGIGRGSLATILGQKVRGIGRGVTQGGQLHESSCGQRTCEKGSNPSMNGFRGTRTDEDVGYQRSGSYTGGFGSRPENGDVESSQQVFRGGFGGSTGGGDRSCRIHESNGTAHSGFDGSSYDDNTHKSYSHGGFNNRRQNDDGDDGGDSTGFCRKPNGSSRHGFGHDVGRINGSDAHEPGRGRPAFSNSSRGGGSCESSRPGTGGGKPREAPYIPPAPSDKEEDIFTCAVQKGIHFDKYDDIPVEVSGRDQCGVINSFDEAGFLPTFVRNIKRANYDKPTPIQKYSIPIIMAARDLMACAQTGSGKTAAFLLPVLTAMIKQGLTTDGHQSVQTPQAVCVAPTRELALQIYTDCRKFAYQTDIRPVVVYGGTSMGYQLRQVETGANIVIGTPGRLLDIINRGKISLEKVSFLILDEADRMLDMGFEPEVRKLVETLGMPPKTERQTLMFSATFPEEIQHLAADFLNDYLFVTVGRVGGANSDVSQYFFEVDRLQKRDSLCDILGAGEGEKTLVFVEMKRNADFLASYLCQSGFPTTSIHGDRLQREREEALKDFKTGKAHVLVATSVAARGLDIPAVMHVVNYDLPSSIDEYVHRIGRTGRCGNLGKATSFFSVDSDQLMAPHLVRILKEAEQPVPDWLAAHACGMGAGDAGQFAGRFGGKDIRKVRQFGGGAGRHSATNSWAAGAGAGTSAAGDDDDDENWG